MDGRDVRDANATQRATDFDPTSGVARRGWELNDAFGPLWVVVGLTLFVLAMQTSRSPGRTGSLLSQVGQRTPLRLAINQASRNELMLLPSIGPRIADRLIQARQNRGRFASWDDLQSVHGIGPMTIAKIQQWADLDPPTAGLDNPVAFDVD